MQKILIAILILSFISAACTDVKLPRENPATPIESYQELPK